MTFSKMLKSDTNVTIFQVDANDVSKGFRINMGTQSAVLPLEDATELAEYIWVRIPDGVQNVE